MGLCKCPKRRVTNQFCFEHRVNVCEHCMVQKHPKVRNYFISSFKSSFLMKPVSLLSAQFKVIFNGFKIVIIIQIALFVIKNLPTNHVFDLFVTVSKNLFITLFIFTVNENDYILQMCSIGFVQTNMQDLYLVILPLPDILALFVVNAYFQQVILVTDL